MAKVDLNREFDTFADHVLSLILDDQECDRETSRMADQKIGRKRNGNDPDPDWWDAKTEAVNELIDRARALNNVGRSA